MIRYRRELTPDDVDSVVDTVASMAENLRGAADRIARQSAAVEGITARLERLAHRLQEGGTDA